MKGNNEHILEYISRIKDLRFAILEEDREYYRDFARNRPEDVDRLTLDSFVDGLPPHIRTRLQQHQFDTLDEAFDQAVLVDKEIDRDRLRFSEQKTPRLTCQLCNKTGHDARSCWNNQDSASQLPERRTLNHAAEYGYQEPKPLLPYWDENRPPPSRPTELRICDYCKKPGHVTSECRKSIFTIHRDPRTLWETESGMTPPSTDGCELWSGPNRSAPTYDTPQVTSGIIRVATLQLNPVVLREKSTFSFSAHTANPDLKDHLQLINSSEIDTPSTMPTIEVEESDKVIPESKTIRPKETTTPIGITPIHPLIKNKSLLAQDPSIHHLEAPATVHSLSPPANYAKLTLPLNSQESLAATPELEIIKISAEAPSRAENLLQSISKEHPIPGKSDKFVDVAPRAPKQTKEFLGLTRYYRRFIPESSRKARPLTSLSKKSTPFDWEPSQQTAFDYFTSVLQKEPILQFSNFEREFHVTTDVLSHKTPAVEARPMRPRGESDDDLEDWPKRKPSRSKSPRFSKSPIHTATSDSNSVDLVTPTSSAHQGWKPIQQHRKMRRKLSPAEIPPSSPPENIPERLPNTRADHTYKLPVHILLTKYLVCVLLSLFTSINTADVFTKRFICHFGAPRAVLTDQAANFTSAFTKAAARKCKIQQFRTTAFHPQTKGSIEKLHVVLTEYLKMFIGRYSDWDEWTDLATFSYNTGVHEGTGYTPRQLVFGKLARVPSRNPVTRVFEKETYNGYLSDLSRKLRCESHYCRHIHIRESPG
ncbi:uncharacterized protein LOC143378183 [Andrena cerasifolii]|uniref:uncharacterized protein LOC143378183 n=1 Tax=Andrena cerasifolii TaxID=2819439 RepID=UPI004037E1E7